VLCLVTDRHLARKSLPDAVAAAVRGGVDLVQLREKDLDGAELLTLADAVRAAARAVREDVTLLVNRRVDVAAAAGFDGVHLGFDAPPLEVARAVLGDAAWISVATHDPEELAGVAAGADLAHLAPIFPPLSKAASRPPLGTRILEQAARQRVPILAQGGVDASNAGACVAAGALGVAVTGALLGVNDPEAAARDLRHALDAATAARSTDDR
jgi:thiamine-phosphate pyrophosphorylase